ncbi:TerC family protein [Ferviditalea candida]|uniref:Tellurium resistance protein TerC n=1 Tax=Ferviditalea candida TaxID=3108399 RepID=A0ABU5ZKN1_9BACL|nr:hypothetical protein [Paenibacillaceae bacterium T2]
MNVVVKIFLLNFFNDLDNVLIIAALLRKYSYDQYPSKYYQMIYYSIIALTITRTGYVFISRQLAEISGLRFFSGLVIIGLALRIVLTATRTDETRWFRSGSPSLSMLRMLALVVMTDFVICMDSIIVTAQLSDHVLEIMLGIFISLLITFTFMRYISKIFNFLPWIQIIVAGIMSQAAVLGMSKDPLLQDYVQWFNQNFANINTAKLFDVLAIDMGILMLLIGIFQLSRGKK